MINLKTELTLPAVGLTGFEAPLNDIELAIQDTLHKFAKDVLRPAGQELDKMSAEQVIAPGSPYYEVLGKAAQLGLDSSLLEQMPPEFASLHEGRRFEAEVVRNALTDQLIQAIVVRRLPPLRRTSVDETVWSSLPTTNEAKPVDWDEFE